MLVVHKGDGLIGVGECALDDLRGSGLRVGLDKGAEPLLGVVGEADLVALVGVSLLELFDLGDVVYLRCWCWGRRDDGGVIPLGAGA